MRSRHTGGSISANNPMTVTVAQRGWCPPIAFRGLTIGEAKKSFPIYQSHFQRSGEWQNSDPE